MLDNFNCELSAETVGQLPSQYSHAQSLALTTKKKKTQSPNLNKVKHMEEERRPSSDGQEESVLSRPGVLHGNTCFPCRYLVEGSCGIPFYCEELLKNLDHHKVLLFQQAETEEKTNVTWSNLFSK